MASHDQYIDLYLCGRGYQHCHRLKGHSAYITHIDWSIDSRILMVRIFVFSNYTILAFLASHSLYIAVQLRWLRVDLVGRREWEDYSLTS